MPKKNERVKGEKRDREKTNKQNKGGPQHPEKKLERQDLKSKNEKQSHYMMAIQSSNLIFGIGSAGTGKSYIAATMAADALERGDIEEIRIVRPIVESGKGVGFLPGEMNEKVQPYYAPFIDILNRRLGDSFVEYLINKNIIKLEPLDYMRGATFKHSWVILDEAQNTTPEQMELFLTRIGGDCKIIVNGDHNQSDLKSGNSGLVDAVHKMKEIDEVEIVEFDRRHVVRSGLARKIVQAYENNKQRLMEIDEPYEMWAQG